MSAQDAYNHHFTAAERPTMVSNTQRMWCHIALAVIALIDKKWKDAS